ncbi:hypothetical protein [Scytonema millei]|uniref:hypothetical protein n=1 Tax=Scytonema millei TaxID=1245922 RepID=UPI002852E1CD|nr:hypothetical protein [Scytonema millei]
MLPRRGSVAQRQPSTVNHQPSTVNCQPSTVNRQPSTINHQPSTVNHQPSTINHQPSTVNRQPSTVNHQPTTNNKYRDRIIFCSLCATSLCLPFLPHLFPLKKSLLKALSRKNTKKLSKDWDDTLIKQS